MKRLTLILLLLVAAAPCTFRSQAQERPWMKYITPSGYYQAGYSIDDALNNTFYIKRARIALAGELIAGALTVILPTRGVLAGIMLACVIAAVVFIGGGRRYVAPIYNREE